jgi:hypothetical protein
MTLFRRCFLALFLAMLACMAVKVLADVSVLETGPFPGGYHYEIIPGGLLTGTNVAGTLPVADSNTEFDSISVSGSAAKFYKIFPTTLSVSATAGSLVLLQPATLVSGTLSVPIGTGTVSLGVTSGTSYFLTQSGSTYALTGTSFTLSHSTGAAAVSGCTLSATGWSLLTGTNGGAIVQ